MATIGLRDLYRAPITIGTSGAEEYGTPVRMAKAISAELSVEVAEAILYADDGADEVVKEVVSGEITLNVNDLLPADLAALLGQKQDTDKVVYGSDSDEAPYTAIGFRAKKAGGTYKYIWLYKVKFAIPDENYTTKGDSIEFTTPEIVGQFIKRSDGLWKAEHVAEPTNSVATACSLPFVSLTTRAVNRISKGGTAGSLKRLPALFC
ncbi:MAG: major tail protein [Clostridium fessum]